MHRTGTSNLDEMNRGGWIINSSSDPGHYHVYPQHSHRVGADPETSHVASMYTYMCLNMITADWSCKHYPLWWKAVSRLVFQHRTRREYPPQPAERSTGDAVEGLW